MEHEKGYTRVDKEVGIPLITMTTFPALEVCRASSSSLEIPSHAWIEINPDLLFLKKLI